MPFMGPRIVLLAVAILFACPKAAFAEPPSVADAGRAPTADELNAQGVELRRQGEDAEALAVFERAHALRPSARAAAQVGLAQQALGHWREAEQGLLQALRGPVDEADSPWLARNRVYLEAGLTVVQNHLGWLRVDSDTSGAEVWIAGQLGGRLPLDHPIRVVAGDVSVEVRASGFEAIRRAVAVEAGSEASATFTFGPPRSDAVPPAAGKRPTRAQSGRRTAGWVTLGGAGGLLLVGIAANATREREVSIYNDDSQCGPSAGQSRYDRCRANRDIGSVAETVAIVTYAGAAVAGIAAGVLLLGGSPAASAPVALRAECGFAANGLLCVGAF
jgi:hypothetical protein